MFNTLGAWLHRRTTRMQVPHFLLGIVLILAIALRFTALGQIPHGITWDEAAIGYNGYATAVYHRDEWLAKLPVSFQSFGDYKAPLAIYLTGAFTGVFGLSAFVLRLPFALAGVSVVLSLYWLVLQIWPDRSSRWWYALIAAVFVATSPWHIHFSRTGFESGLSLAALSVGMVCWIVFLQDLGQTQTRFQLRSSYRWGACLAAVILLSATLYTYHSAKITTPLVTLVVTLLFAPRPLLRYWKWLMGAVILAAVLLLPVLLDSLHGEGATRAGVLLFSLDLSMLELMLAIGKNIWAHLTPQYLIGGQVTHLRDGVGAWGILLPTSAVFFILGLLRAGRALFFERRSSFYTVSVLGVAWYLLGMLPAFLSQTVPHTNRSLGALPGYVLLVVIGVASCVEFLKQRSHHKSVVKIVLGTILCLHIFFVAAFWQYYTTSFAAQSAEAFTDGYLAVFERTEAYLKGKEGLPQVAGVRMSNVYGQPYIFALFAKEMNPIAYRGGALNNYSFADEITVGDFERENILLVATPQDDMSKREPIETIYGSDGSPRFLLYLSKRVEE